MSEKSQYSISPIAAAVSTALVAPAAALAQEEGATSALEEIIVTARKREENLQRIPSTIHALPEAMLKKMGALNTEDYVRFMPSVNWINFNPGGSNTVIFRGVNTTTLGYTGTQSSSVYLDEIPLTATDGTQPDIRMMDVSRTEALSGPQGTLFGAAAQAGTLRIITNKPDASRFESSADVTWRTGEDSDPSHSVTGVLNIPLVEDVFAVRLAAQSAEDGGYIDNVSGHTPDTKWDETAAENAAANAGPYQVWYWGTSRLEWGNLRNDDVVEDNWNSAKHTNVRVSARWNVNDNWSATAAYHYGDTKSEGSAGYNPYVGDLQTIGFVKNRSHSEWDMTSLTIEADYGFTQFVSATSFYDNQRTYVIDNTLYYKYYTSVYCGELGDPASQVYGWVNTSTGRAIYAPMYCVTPVAGDPLGGPTQLADMVGVGEGPEWQERFTQEFRLSHQGETFDWLAGLYYEDSNDSWNSVWMKDAKTPFPQSTVYAFMRDCASGVNQRTTDYWECSADSEFGQLGTIGGADAMNAALDTADHYWDSRDDTDWETTAVFGEITWHATDAMNVTVGGRWFETENIKTYVKMLAGHTLADGRHAGGYIQQRWIGNEVPQTATISEFVPKFSLAYNLSDDKMVYGTYTEGYRTGGINRANNKADWTRTLWPQQWEADRLKNYEAGLRSRWADGTVQLNLTYFYMDWTDFQHEVVDPSSGTCVVPEEADDTPACETSGKLPWISIVGNVGDAHSTGVTAEFDWVPADNWQVGANAQWLSAEVDSISIVPTGDDHGIRAGQKLPNIPEFQGALWATYNWPVNFVPGAEMFVRGQYSFTGETHTRLDMKDESTPLPTFFNDAYGIGDVRFGLVSPDGGWQIDVFVNNVTDERAQLWQGAALGAWAWGRSGEYEHGHDVYTVRPREYGLRFSAQWGD